MGKSSVDGGCSITMFDYRRVFSAIFLIGCDQYTCCIFVLLVI